MKKITTSKKLTWVMTLIYIFSILSYIISRIIYNVDLIQLIYATSASYGVILKFYFDKSKAENQEKIKHSNLEGGSKNDN